MSKPHELLDDLQTHIEDKLLGFKLSLETAKEIGESIRCFISNNWGGQNLYFPKDMDRQRLARNQEMYSKFDGSNHDELAKEYNLTTRAVYRVLKSIHEKKKR